MNEGYSGFADRLRRHCATHGLSQAEVSRRFGHSGTIVGHYFAGRHAPSEENEADLAGAIGVPRNTLREWLGRSAIADPDADDLDRIMVELRPLLNRMAPARRRAAVAIVREIAEL